MRPALVAAGALTSLFVLAGCASDVGEGIDQARSSAASVAAGVRSSAASIGAGVRSACDASGDSLTRLDGLAGRIADNADEGRTLAPQVRQTVDQLATQIADRDELQPVVAAGRDLVKSIGDANDTAIELSARQAQVAVRSAQAVCKLAK
jgi:hypothetical protein